MDPKKTGEFLAQLRKEQGLTQKELAEKLHVSDKAISRWETGKGFPETGLLITISELLGISVGELLSGQRMEQARIKEETDKVIVQSFRQTDKKAAAMVLTAVVSAVVIFALLIGWIATALPREIQAMDFLCAEIPMRYELGKDNANTAIEYGDFLRRDFDGGYEYYTPNGTERYVFTHIPELSGEPVMSYMHCSAPGWKLFGVEIGDSTLVEKNPALGVAEDHSLMRYLKDQGFQGGYEEFQFGRRSLVYVDDERCNWLFYYKDNVFINLLVSAHEGRRLLGFDVGILDENLESILMEQIHGYRLRIEDPYDLLRPDVQEVQIPGASVTLYAMKPREDYEALFLYINGMYVAEFSETDDPIWSKTITFQMLAQETTILVTPEKQHD